MNDSQAAALTTMVAATDNSPTISDFPFEVVGGLLVALMVYAAHRFDLWIVKRRRGPHYKD